MAPERRWRRGWSRAAGRRWRAPWSRPRTGGGCAWCSQHGARLGSQQLLTSTIIVLSFDLVAAALTRLAAASASRRDPVVPSIDLTGKVAVVTGSGRGLGLAYAHALAAAGASVVVNDVDEAVAEQAVKAITAAGGSAVAEVVPVG